MTTALEHAHPPNTCQYMAQTNRGEYLVQIAWPLCWSKDRVPPENDGPVSILYVVDGNAYFFTAMEISRRLEFTDTARTIVVGIGYPNTFCVYDHRRGPDFTPPAADGKYDIPLDGYGKRQDHLPFGEASKFLDVIESDIMPHVENTIFASAPLSAARKVLFGHSWGGLFALHALFTKPTLFNTFIAGSPSVGWNHSSILKEQEVAFRECEHPADPAPSLAVTWGSAPAELVRKPNESDKAWENRKDTAEEVDMREVGEALVARLRECPSVRDVWSWEFAGEDHGSASVTALQQGLIKFLGENK